MKKVLFWRRLVSLSTIAVVCLGVLLASCNNGTAMDGSSLENILERPVSIYNADKSAGVVSSYQANVKQYYSNDRNGANMEVVSEYRLSLKLINNDLFTRIDYGASTSADGIARTIVSNADESVVYKTDTQEIEYRIPVINSAKRLMPTNVYRSLMGRLNLDSIAIHSRTLAFDVIDETPGVMVVNIPSGFFPDTSDGSDFTSRVAKYSIRYDTVNSVEIVSEMEIHESDGTVVAVSTYPIYKEDGEDMIKVGQVMVSDFDVPGEFDTSDSVIENSNLNSGEFVLAEGSDPVLLGDPASPDMKETFVDLYEDIELNSLSDTYFRMSF